MSFVWIDDVMPYNEKIIAAGPVAFALDVAGLCYSNRHKTEGFIADHVLTAVLPGLSRPRTHAAKLVEVGRWERDDARGGWVIHDYGDWQLTREQRQARKDAKQAKGVLGNHVRWHEGRGIRDPNCPHCIPGGSSRDSPGNRPGNPRASPYPTRPDPGEHTHAESATQHAATGDGGVLSDDEAKDQLVGALERHGVPAKASARLLAKHPRKDVERGFDVLRASNGVRDPVAFVTRAIRERWEPREQVREGREYPDVTAERLAKEQPEAS